MSISCTNMSPTVRVLALRALAATSERVMPVARNFWYGGRPPLGADEVPPAHSARIRRAGAASQEVRICQKRAPKNARSSGVRPVTGPNARRISRSSVPASAGVCGKIAGMRNVGFPYCVNADARRRHQVIGHLAPVERRDAPHRVDHVLVEAREEPKPVLAGQAVLDGRDAGVGELVSARAGAVVDHRDAARLAARDAAALEDDDLEAALDQLVRGAHARDAAAEDDDPGQ